LRIVGAEGCYGGILVKIDNNGERKTAARLQSGNCTDL
jgi:hypothetical protein